jgi:hypothetical protein
MRWSPAECLVNMAAAQVERDRAQCCFSKQCLMVLCNQVFAMYT